MGSRLWCDYCFSKHQASGATWQSKGEWNTHDNSDHGWGKAEFIDAKDLQSGDVFYTTYRNQPQFMRCVSARPGKQEGTIWILDNAHRSWTVPATKRIQVQRINDTYTIPEDK